MAKISDMMLRKLEGEKGKTQKITVGAGLQLWISINQAGKTSKVWYLRYYDAQGKQQRSKLGEYPELSLAKALGAAEDAKAAAKDGIGLAAERAKAKRVIAEANQEKNNIKTFESVANAWLEKKGLNWEARHAKRQRERLVGNIFPVFGHLDINEITMEHVDNALLPVIGREARETAQRICTIIRNVFEYADTMGYLADPMITVRLTKYRKDMPQPLERKHLYNEMSADEIGKLMLAIEQSKMRWTMSTSIALRLAPYVIVRPGELCGMQWSELNLEAAEWFIPGERMKAGKDHIVPLSRQATALLREIQPYSGYHQYVFPSTRSGSKHLPITTSSLIQALRRIGFASTRSEADSFTTHGFRGMASTSLHQRLKYNSDFVEHQLAHTEQNKVKAAYNRITARSYLEERREMLQAYADYLDTLRENAK